MHYTKSYPTGMPLGLLDNFNSMMALLEAGKLSAEKARNLQAIIKKQIVSAEKISMSICPGTQPDLFIRARQVLGFGDEMQEHNARLHRQPKLEIVASS